MQQNASQRVSGKNQPSAGSDKSLPVQTLKQMQLQAIDLLLQGLSDAEVAAQINVARTTVFRWRKNQAFALHLRKLRERLFEQSAARIQNLIQPSLEILTRQLKSSDEKLAMRAASTLLRLATNAHLCGNKSPARTPSASKKKRHLSSFLKAAEDYINSPMPVPTTAGGLTPKVKF